VVKRIILVTLFLTLLFGGIFGWKHYAGQQKAKSMSTPPPPTVVSSTRVQVEVWQPALKAVGTLVASKGINVANEVVGIVKSVEFESGQSVNEGDVLLTLNDDVDRADLAALTAAEKLANLNFKRLNKLIHEKTVSQSTLDEARAELDSTSALLNAKRASIRKKTIRAAFAGRLGIRQADIGQYLAAGTQIVNLQSLSPIYVDYSLPERYLDKLSPGQAVVVQVSAYPDHTFKGEISAISPRIATDSRSVRIRATFANQEQLLRPGMFADVATQLPIQNNVLTLPQRVVSYNPYGNAVFLLVDKDGQLTAESRQVQTGDVHNGRLEIISGLVEGDTVAADGLNKLRNGQAVTIDNSVDLDAKPAES
jgi:membrane fusion protein (multidrug efflux system)